MPDSAETQGLVSRAFLCSLIAFVVLSPLYREYQPRSSWWDAAAARRVSSLLRVAILLEVVRNGWLLYNVISAGDPTQDNQRNLDYYWTFGFGRPVAGITLMGLFGSLGEMHAVFRTLSVCGAVAQAAFDALSAVQVGEYYNQVKYFNAPSGNYTLASMYDYYWMDIISFGISTYILLLGLHQCCIVGFIQLPYVNYQAIRGGDVDRVETMRREVVKRSLFDFQQQGRRHQLFSSRRTLKEPELEVSAL